MTSLNDFEERDLVLVSGYLRRHMLKFVASDTVLIVAGYAFETKQVVAVDESPATPTTIINKLDDFFSQVLCGSDIKVTNNGKTIIKSNYNSAQTVYSSKLLNWKDKGIHTFKFKIDKKTKSPKKDNITIGITGDINATFKNADFAKCSSVRYYGYRSDGKKVSYPKAFHSYSSPVRTFTTGDVITLYLDFNYDESKPLNTSEHPNNPGPHGLIGFKHNDKDLGIAYKYVNLHQHKEFRVAVRIKTSQDSVSILSYEYTKAIDDKEQAVLEYEKELKRKQLRAKLHNEKMAQLRKQKQEARMKHQAKMNTAKKKKKKKKTKSSKMFDNDDDDDDDSEKDNNSNDESSSSSEYWYEPSTNNDGESRCVRCGSYYEEPDLEQCKICNYSVCDSCTVWEPQWAYNCYGSISDAPIAGDYVACCSRKCARQVETRDTFWECND